MTQQTRTINHMMSFLEFIRVFEETVLYIFPLKHEGKHNHLNDEYGKESGEYKWDAFGRGIRMETKTRPAF